MKLGIEKYHPRKYTEVRQNASTLDLGGEGGMTSKRSPSDGTLLRKHRNQKRNAQK